MKIKDYAAGSYISSLKFDFLDQYNSDELFRNEIDDLRKKNVTSLSLFFYINKLHSYIVNLNNDSSEYITALKKIKSMRIYEFVYTLFEEKYKTYASNHYNLIAVFYIVPNLTKQSCYRLYYGEVEYEKEPTLRQ